MYSLLIETSSQKAFLSIGLNGLPIASKTLNGDSNLSTTIYPSLKKLLSTSNLEIADLGYISIGTGPGSYTGIRVGASMAKALSYGKHIPIIGFCSLKAFIPSFNTYFYSIIDAKTSGFYILEGERINSKIIYKSHPRLISLEDTQSLFSLKNPYPLISPNIEALQKRLPEISDQLFTEKSPDAEHLANLTHVKYMNKKFDLSQKLQLLYLREPNPVAL